jgi:hypothetical protein
MRVCCIGSYKSVILCLALLPDCASSQSGNLRSLLEFPKIARSDVTIYANLFGPQPRLTLRNAGVFADKGSQRAKSAAGGSRNLSD